MAKTGDTIDALAMSNNKITGLADSISSQDVATKYYVDRQGSLWLAKIGGIMTDDLAMTGNWITNLADLILSQDAANKNYMDGQGKTSTFMSGHLIMGLYRIAELPNHIASQDAATKHYVNVGDTMIGNLSMGSNRGDGYLTTSF